MNRREWLQKCSRCLLGISSLHVFSGCKGLYYVHLIPQKKKLFLPRTELQKLISSEDTLVVSVAPWDMRFYVRQVQKGEYIALSSLCTHRGCTLDSEPTGYQCPCHGSRFDLKGEVIKGPAVDALSSYRTNTTPEGLWIHTL